MSAPLFTCGAADADRETIEAVAEEYERVVQHAADEAELARLLDGTAPGVVFIGAAGGLDATAVCRAWNHGDVPVVVVGEDDSLDTKVEALEAGADQFLVTPVDEEALRFVLRFFIVEKGR